MKTIYGMLGCSILTVALAGCGPELAQTPLGEKEQAWQSSIKTSYPSWKPPQAAPPAIRNNMSKDFEDDASEGAASQTEPTVDDTQSAADTSNIPTAAEDAVDTGNSTDSGSAAGLKPDADSADETATEASGSDQIYTVQKGDSLSLIAKKFYKDGRKYYLIMKANQDTLNGKPDQLSPGMKLKIPSL